MTYFQAPITDLFCAPLDNRLRFGFYPESVHVDKLYRTRENRSYCQAKGIRLSGPPLGRPGEETKLLRRLVRQDEIDRIAIESKFGQGKRRFSLARVMAKLAITSEAVVMVSFLVMNLEKILAGIISFLFLLWQWMLERGSPDYSMRQRWIPVDLSGTQLKPLLL